MIEKVQLGGGGYIRTRFGYTGVIRPITRRKLILNIERRNVKNDPKGMDCADC